MPKPYSEDLREKVLKVFDAGEMTIKKISEVFNIDEKTCGGKGKKKQEV